MNYRVGVDIGGTFTDVVLEDAATGMLRIGKVLTSPSDPSIAVIEGIVRLLGEADVATEEVDVVIHGTTLATNAVIERTGALTALLTTEGFIDVLAIARESRYDHYDLQLELPEPLVARALRCGVAERIDRDGNIMRPLDIDQLGDALTQLRAAGVESIAVVYLHAYKNAVHEHATASYISTIDPELPVSLSSEVAPEIREYERTSTTVINAYLQPIVERYLERLGGRLQELGLHGAFHLMLSSELLTTAKQARRFPTRLIESGPAGGVMLGAYYAKLICRKDLIAFDMGGTTAKASLFEDEQAQVAREFEVARVDRHPTVTDADLVLGYLNPDYFLGGEIKLDGDAAAQAIEQAIAKPLGLNLMQAAWGIHRVVNEQMANAFRIHAMEHGRDPADHALMFFGGAGPVHAYGIARVLRSPSIIAPAAVGVAAAVGFLIAPVAAEAARAYVVRLDYIDWTHLGELLDELEATGHAFLREAGIAVDAATVTRSADMQYVGQMHDIAVPIPSGRLRGADEERLRDAFDRRYRALFQRTVARIPVEALTWRVTVSAPAPDIDLRWRARSSADHERKTTRSVYFPEPNDFIDTPVYDRYALKPGDAFVGPAIIEDRIDRRRRTGCARDDGRMG